MRFWPHRPMWRQPRRRARSRRSIGKRSTDSSRSRSPAGLAPARTCCVPDRASRFVVTACWRTARSRRRRGRSGSEDGQWRLLNAAAPVNRSPRTRVCVDGELPVECREPVSTCALRASMLPGGAAASNGAADVTAAAAARRMTARRVSRTDITLPCHDPNRCDIRCSPRRRNRGTRTG